MEKKEWIQKRKMACALAGAFKRWGRDAPRGDSTAERSLPAGTHRALSTATVTRLLAEGGGKDLRSWKLSILCVEGKKGSRYWPNVGEGEK